MTDLTKKGKVYLIRHAETTANAEAQGTTRTITIYQNQGLIPLSDKGLEQAKELADAVEKPHKVFVSKFHRTHETAKPLLTKHELPHEILDFTHEFDYLDESNLADENGEYTRERLMAVVGEYWNKLDPEHQDSEHRESFAHFVERVKKFIDFAKNTRDSGEDITYFFSHAHFIKMVLVILEEFKDKEASTKELMQRFKERIHDQSYKINNTQVVDITELL